MIAGSIFMYAGSIVPNGFLECDGSAVSRITYSDLFDSIGTIYGVGDGSTTFNLPNLSGKVAIGVSNNHSLGTSGGSETVTITNNEIPAHTHEVGQHGHDNNITASYPALSHTVTQPAYNYNAPNGGTNIRRGAWPENASGYRGTSNATASRTNASIAAHNASDCTMSGDILTTSDTNTSSVGSDMAHNNMQPYITMMYIISVGG